GMEFSSELHAGGAPADDGDAQRRQLLGRSLGPEQQPNQTAVKILRLRQRVEVQAMLGGAGDPEMIADAADSDDQDLVGDLTGRDDLVAALVAQGRQQDLLALAIQPAHTAVLKAEAVAVRLSQVGDRVRLRIQRAGRHLVVERLPDVDQTAVDQNDVSLAGASQAASQPRGQLQPSGAAADDDYALRPRSWHRRLLA